MKRLTAALLWFLNGWFVGSAGAWVLDVSPVLAPIIAIATAGIILFDPRHIIWTRTAVASDTLAAQSA